MGAGPPAAAAGRCIYSPGVRTIGAAGRGGAGTGRAAGVDVAA
jgi:hypothetical protein